MSNKKDFFGQPIVHGIATGPALISKKAISFLGDLNITTGEVTGELSDLIGKKISKTILVVPSTRGSAGAWRFIYQLKQFEKKLQPKKISDFSYLDMRYENQIIAKGRHS